MASTTKEYNDNGGIPMKEQEQEKKRQQTEEEEWEWHILMTRSRVVIQDNPNRIVSVDEHAPNDSLGYNISIVRMKSNEHDDVETSSGNEVPSCPWLLQTPQSNNESSFFAYKRLDMDALKSNKQQLKSLLHVLTVWPLGTSVFLTCRMRVLLHWKEMVCHVGDPIRLLQEALKACANDEIRKHDDDEHLLNDWNAFGYSPEMLLAARRTMPSAMIVHVPSDVLQQEQEIDTVIRNIFPTVPHVKVSGPCTQFSTDWMDRILWTYDFHNHLDFRWSLMYNCQRSSAQEKCRGRRNHETEDFWGSGVPFKTMDVNEKKNLLAIFQDVTKLVATRPWSRWKSFEILKVTVKTAANEEIDTKWIMFSSEECYEADSLTRSPYGFMQIMNSLSDRDYIFGRSSLIYASMDTVPPDRLFIASDSLSHVHYDSILLLEQLFGEPLVPEQLLPRGVIPLMEAETGKIPGHVGGSQPTSSRSFTDEEMDWVRICIPSITKFVTEERNACDKNGGEWCKTYTVVNTNDSTHNQVASKSLYSQASNVTISYNMGIENGGLWDRERKWQWF